MKESREKDENTLNGDGRRAATGGEQMTVRNVYGVMMKDR